MTQGIAKLGIDQILNGLSEFMNPVIAHLFYLFRKLILMRQAARAGDRQREKTSGFLARRRLPGAIRRQLP